MDQKVYLMSILDYAIQQKGQDVFLKSHSVPRLRLGNRVVEIPSCQPIDAAGMRALAESILTAPQIQTLQQNKSVDFGFDHSAKGCRFRGNAFFQQGTLSMVFRLLWKGIPRFSELNLPPVLEKVALEKSGIILIAGTVSSGKRRLRDDDSDHERKSPEAHYDDRRSGRIPSHGRTMPDSTARSRRRHGKFNSAIKYMVRQSPMSS